MCQNDAIITIPKRDLQISSNALQDFSISVIIDDFAETTRSRTLDLMGISSASIDAINQIKNSKSFLVEIPKQFIEGIKNGDFKFDKSSKIKGNFTPNIRDVNGNLVGQATISEGVNPTVVTSSIMNMAMMSMLAEVSHKLDMMDEKLDEILTGQHQDRIAEVISGFQSFYLAFKSSKDPNELRQRAFIAYNTINEGITKLHFEFDSKCKILNRAPKNDFQSFIKGISRVKKDKNRYYQLESDLKLYYQLHTLLEIVAIYAFDEESTYDVHRPISNMINRLFDDQFIRNMAYITGKDSELLLISQVSQIDKNYSNNIQYNYISIEADNTEIKQLS